MELVVREDAFDWTFALSLFKIGSDNTERNASHHGCTCYQERCRPPIPLDSLLILKREGSNLVLLDKLSADDGTAAIKWNGAQSIRSNPDLILKTSDSKGRAKRMSIR
jgi:hypothetical protein